MGYAISWLAIRGKSSSTVRKELGLLATGKLEDVPESKILGMELPSGWYLIFANDCGFAEGLPLGKLSQDAEVVACSVEEHVMFSYATGWRNGERHWAVTHDSNNGIQHLETDGRPPFIFNAIRERLTLEQTEADRNKINVDCIMDVPIELAESLTGFRHNKDIDDDEGQFEILETIPGGAAEKATSFNKG